MRSGPQLARTTPFPNELFALIPSLRDTEWRLLCVIVRQTWGWSTGKGSQRKESDWMTQRQLIARTGRSSEAVSKAIDMLVKRNLIEVRDAEGRRLDSAAARRRSGGRLYFKVTAEPCRNSISDEPTRKIELVASKTEDAIRMSEVRKANTTKETGTKFKKAGDPDDGKLVSASDVTKRVVSQKDVDHFLREYNAHLYQRMQEPESSAFRTVKLSGSEDDERIVYALLQTHELKELLRLQGLFFNRKLDLAERHGISDFKSSIRELLVTEIKENLRRSVRGQ